MKKLLLPLALAALAACSDDAPNEPTPDVGTGDVVDDSTDTGEVTCDDEEVPQNQDICDCEDQVIEGRVDLCDRTCTCTFGFWDCVEDCDEPQVLELAWVGARSLDEASGDGDAQVNPGETWQLTGAIRANNAGEEGADVTVRVTSDSIFVDAEDASVTFDGLGEDEEAFTLPLEVSDSAPSGEVTITIEAFSGFTTIDETMTFEIVPPAEPVLEFADPIIFDADGAEAVRINVGDEITVTSTLRNTGTVAAEGVVVSGSPTSSSLTTPDDQTFGVIAPNDFVSVELAVTVSDDPTDLSPRLTLAATSENAETSTFGVDVPIVAPNTLELVGTTWESLGGSSWRLVVEVRNRGRFPVEGIVWTRRNYVSSEAECEVPEAPCYEASMELGAPSGPSTIAAASTVEVTMEMAVTAETPDEGLVILRAASETLASDPQFSLVLAAPGAGG